MTNIIHKTAIIGEQVKLGKNVQIGLKMWKFGWVLRSDAVAEEQWQSELDLIKATHERLVEAVTSFDPDGLDQVIGKKTIILAVDFMHGIGEHSLYHTAQMEMIKTLAKQNGIQ